MIGPLFDMWRSINAQNVIARAQHARAMEHLRKFAQERKEDEPTPRGTSSPANQRIITETVA